VDFSDHKVNKIKLSPLMAEARIKNWCAYQERSQDETRIKLHSYGLQSEDTESLISKLIGENFLNEERFALALAGGKFRIKHWGKNKIRQELRKHRISEYCVNKALKSIDPDDYETVLKKVIEKKLNSLKPGRNTTDLLAKKSDFYTVLKYAVSRGFESDLVSEQLNLLLE
jgi:regulatory protein